MLSPTRLGTALDWACRIERHSVKPLNLAHNPHASWCFVNCPIVGRACQSAINPAIAILPMCASMRPKTLFAFALLLSCAQRQCRDGKQSTMPLCICLMPLCRALCRVLPCCCVPLAFARLSRKFGMAVTLHFSNAFYCASN